MPAYFFHISLEIFPDPNEADHNKSVVPPNLSHAFKALRPFLRSPPPKNPRDVKNNAHKRTSVPSFHNPSRSIFERTIAEQVQCSSPADHRLDRIHLECADMNVPTSGQESEQGVSPEKHIERGLGTTISGAQTKGRYTTLRKDEAGEEWGIVHLYRDASETPGLYKENSSYLLGADIRDVGNGVPVPKNKPVMPLPPARDEDCATLCILAVPSYLTPADFLAFVGEKTRDQVSHFRMIRTSRQNRYMVLMKFHNGKRAREWQADWNGKVFNSMEPETVHVVFLKSVEIMPSVGTIPQDANTNSTSTFPSIANDPFVTPPVPHTSKPLAPRTPSLIELPTCPVCLERMDETTGLLTILCQHVFHCTCLQKWSGGGCPVCRYTHDDFSTRAGGSHKYKSKLKSKVNGYADDYEVSDDPLGCEVCHANSSLWQCLICGKVGCGRYEGKHAYQHFEETGHTFSMDLETNRVWDYAGDVYVHRIIQDAAKPGEKLIELPGRRRETTALEDVDDAVEVVKMENIAVEYTHLLTSQLESQRVYFEEIVERAVDKASEASKKAERAIHENESMQTQLQKLSFERDELIDKKFPSIESERARLEKRALKFEELAKSVNARYMEEKSLASSLMERIKHLEEKVQELEEDNATKELLMEGLRDEHRDAMMQISAQEKLREMVANGELEPEDLVGATIEAGRASQTRKGKRPMRQNVRDAQGTAATATATAAPVHSVGTEASGKLHANSDVDTEAGERQSESVGGPDHDTKGSKKKKKGKGKK